MMPKQRADRSWLAATAAMAMAGVAIICPPGSVSAGPPCHTDNPKPVGFQHFESGDVACE
jgi:hypothetical protein